MTNPSSGKEIKGPECSARLVFCSSPKEPSASNMINKMTAIFFPSFFFFSPTSRTRRIYSRISIECESKQLMTDRQRVPRCWEMAAQKNVVCWRTPPLKMNSGPLPSRSSAQKVVINHWRILPSLFAPISSPYPPQTLFWQIPNRSGPWWIPKIRKKRCSLLKSPAHSFWKSSSPYSLIASIFDSKKNLSVRRQMNLLFYMWC